MKMWKDKEQILFSDTQLYFLWWFEEHKLVQLDWDSIGVYEHYITKQEIYKTKYRTLFFLGGFIEWFLDFNILIEDEPRRDRFYAENDMFN